MQPGPNTLTDYISAKCDGPGPGGRFTMQLDGTGIIDIVVWGFWSRAEVDTFFVPLTAIHATSRRLHGTVRQMIALKAVQSPAVALDYRAAAIAMKQPGDRTAVVVATMLSKLQIARLGQGRAGFRVFTSTDAARNWLLTP